MISRTNIPLKDLRSIKQDKALEELLEALKDDRERLNKRIEEYFRVRL